MFRTLCLSTLWAMTAGVSLAADLPYRSPPPAPVFAPEPVSLWTGFYVGAQVGWAGTRNDLREVTPTGVFVGTGKNDASGVIGGLHLGYNYQLRGTQFVIGVETDAELAGLRRSSAVEFNPAGVVYAGTYAFATDINWQLSMRGRLGYAFGNVMLYATGGLALANIKTSYTTFGVGAGSAVFTDVRPGWTLGAGLEYAFARNWFGRIEYRYTDFGRITDSVPAGATNLFWAGNNDTHRIQEHAVRAGVSYKF